MNRIFLIGYMGSGKSTLGKKIARKCGLTFIDLDHYIESRYCKTINKIFQEKGEDGFRLIETNILREIGEFENVLIATGGGAPCFNDNIRFMNRQGTCIYLKTSVEALHRRLKQAKQNRPLLRDKNDEELLDFITQSLSKREAIYMQAGTIFNANKLDTYEDIETAVEELYTIISEKNNI